MKLLYNFLHKTLFIKKILYVFISLWCCFFVFSNTNAGYQDLIGYKANKDDIQYVQQETIRLRSLYVTSHQAVLDEQTKFQNELFDLPAANTTKVKQRVFRLKRLIDEIYLMSAKDSNERLLREVYLLMEGQDFIGAYQLCEKSDKTQWDNAMWYSFLEVVFMNDKRKEFLSNYRSNTLEILKDENINFLIYYFTVRRHLSTDGLVLKSFQKSKPHEPVERNELHSLEAKLLYIYYLLDELNYIKPTSMQELSFKLLMENNKDIIEDLRRDKSLDSAFEKNKAVLFGQIGLWKDSYSSYKKAAQLYPTYATYQSLGVANNMLSCNMNDIDVRRSKSKVMLLDKKALRAFNKFTKPLKEYCEKFDESSQKKQLNDYYQRYESL